jgi:two-component system nitrate/nitrite response regulator NarL
MSNRADLKDGHKIRVLLVDDNEAFRRVATDFLQRQCELTVVGAICGSEEALARAQDLGPQVILIGLDRPGLETISRLRKVLPDVGIIALALLEDAAHRQAAIAAGADDLVRKEELVIDLLPVIRRVMQADRSR